MKEFGPRTNLNWVNNVMTWDLSSDNTNPAALTEASLGPFVSKTTAPYHCPSDHALSAVQSAAGWDQRNRSYSMNAMVGDAGDASANGSNVNNPGYVQFFKITQIFQTSEIFIFLDEHPDTIDDGYFINKSTEYASDGYGNPVIPTPNGPICRPRITTMPRRFRLPTGTARCIVGWSRARSIPSSRMCLICRLMFPPSALTSTRS